MYRSYAFILHHGPEHVPGNTTSVKTGTLLLQPQTPGHPDKEWAHKKIQCLGCLDLEQALNKDRIGGRKAWSTEHPFLFFSGCKWKERNWTILNKGYHPGGKSEIQLLLVHNGSFSYFLHRYAHLTKRPHSSLLYYCFLHVEMFLLAFRISK